MHNDSEIKRDDRVASALPHPPVKGAGTVRYVYPGHDGDNALVEWDKGGWSHSRVRYLRKAPTISRVYNLYWDPDAWRVDSYWNETREQADGCADNDYRKRIGVLNVYDNGEVELEPCQQQKN